MEQNSRVMCNKIEVCNDTTARASLVLDLVLSDWGIGCLLRNVYANGDQSHWR